jgi:large subunit ribosomal protein L36e
MRFIYALNHQVSLAEYNNSLSPTTRILQNNQANQTPLQLGTFTRGKRKVEDMQRVIAEARRVGAH